MGHAVCDSKTKDMAIYPWKLASNMTSIEHVLNENLRNQHMYFPFNIFVRGVRPIIEP